MQQGSRKSNGDGRRSRWSAHREQRRTVLVEAAVQAVLRYGPEADMAQVATVAGVSKPVLYRYFADKAELWLAVGEHVARLVVAEIVPVVARVRPERELVSATIDAYLAAIGTNPDLYRFLVHQSGVPGMAHLVSNAARMVATELARAVGDRLRALGLDAGPAEPWAYGMVGMVQSVGDWWIRHDRPISRAALTEYLTTLLWHGLDGVRAAADVPGGLSSMRIPGDDRGR